TGPLFGEMPCFSSASPESIAVKPAVPIAMASRADRPCGSATSPSPSTRALGIGTEMGLAHAPAGADDLVARLPRRMGGGFDRTCEIDAGDHREAAHHGRLAREREAVL